MTTDPVEWAEPEVIDLAVVNLKSPAGKQNKWKRHEMPCTSGGFSMSSTMDLTELKFANQGTVA